VRRWRVSEPTDARVVIVFKCKLRGRAEPYYSTVFTRGVVGYDARTDYEQIRRFVSGDHFRDAGPARAEHLQ